MPHKSIGESEGFCIYVKSFLNLTFGITSNRIQLFFKFFMPFCPVCGSNINPGFAFCPVCGSKQSHDVAFHDVERGRIRIKSLTKPGLFGSYEGFHKNGIPEGDGVAFYDNCDKYEGEWHEGLKQGRGISIIKDYGRYVGEWVNDGPSGHFKFYFQDGELYEGEDRPELLLTEALFRGVVHSSTGTILFFTPDGARRRNWTFLKQPDGRFRVNDLYHQPLLTIVIKWDAWDGFKEATAFFKSRGVDEYCEEQKSRWNHVIQRLCRLDCHAEHITSTRYVIVNFDTGYPFTDYFRWNSNLFDTREAAIDSMKQSCNGRIDLTWGATYADNGQSYWQILEVNIADFPKM